MAHKKAGGSTTLGRDSESKRLGVKLFDGETAMPGNVIVRQRGTKIRPGMNVTRGEDDTLFAAAEGTVEFSKRKVKKFGGALRTATFVRVVPKPKKK